MKKLNLLLLLLLSTVALSQVSSVRTFVEDIVKFTGTGAVSLPSGTEAQRPGTPVEGMLRYNSDSSKTEQYTNGAWGEVGAGGAGGINYISNSDIEINVDGYSLYEDGVVSSPVDGTGGSPNVAVTLTQNTTTPLRELADLQFLKDANDRQGHGFSYDFSIDSGAQSQPMTASFWYDASDASYASNDITVHLYDVTNASYVPINNSNIVEGKGIHYFNFTARSDSTSYRLVFHQASANASGYSIYFDEVKVTVINPNYNLVSLNPVSDYESKTCSINWTNATSSCLMKRVGDEAFFNFTITKQSGVAGGSLVITLPAGIVIDTSKLQQTNTRGSIGTAKLYYTSNPNSIAMFSPENSTSLRLDFITTGGVFSRVSDSNPYTGSAGDTIKGQFKFPVVGWSSGVDAVAQFEEPLKVEVNDNDGQAVTANTEHIIFKTELTDNKGAWSSGHTLTIPAGYAGRYHVNGQLRADTSDVPSWSIRLRVNGTNGKYCGRAELGRTLPFSCYVDLEEGDTLGIASTDTFTVESSQSALHFLSIEQVPSSFNIAAPIDSQKWKCQRKHLTADVSTPSTVLTDVSFSNLIVGKKYEITSFFVVVSGAFDARYNIDTKNGATSISRLEDTATASGEWRSNTNVTKFVATDAAITSTTTAVFLHDVLGNSTDYESWVQLCELPDNYDLTYTGF